MASLTMDMPHVNVSVRIIKPVAYRVRMAMLCAFLKVAEIVSPPNVHVDVVITPHDRGRAA